MVDWTEFDNKVDLGALKKEIEDAKKNGNVKIPSGRYEVEITDMELKESSKKDPMVTIKFKILKGEHKGMSIWMNQVIVKPLSIHIMNEFLRSLGTDVTIEFESYKQYDDLLLDIFEAVDGNFEYDLNLGYKDDYPTFKILKVYPLE